MCEGSFLVFENPVEMPSLNRNYYYHYHYIIIIIIIIIIIFIITLELFAESYSIIIYYGIKLQVS